MRTRGIQLAFAIVPALLGGACGGGSSGTPDAGLAVTTDNCTYQPMVATANSGGTVSAGALTAGAGERVIGAPVGSALGGYAARAGFLGATTAVVDGRKTAVAGSFIPSIGVETAPRAKAVALSAGGETIVIVKLDAIFVYEGMLFDLEDRLGAQFHGKVVLAASHSHSAWSQFTAHGALKVGAGEQRDIVYQAELDAAAGAAQDALGSMVAAKIGFFSDTHFDPTDQISHDRRGENDSLPGGNRKDDHFYLIRVDTAAGAPIAVVPIYGVHGTLMGEDNPLASTDSIGAMERVVEEQFDSKVVVMHLQSAGADTSPSGHGGLDCGNHPGASSDPCLSYVTLEGHGRAAAPTIMAAWDAAGASMQSSIELEMLTRSVETGPKPQTFTIRNGAVAYAPFDLNRSADRVIMNGTSVASPVDEFDAPVGAALCEKTDTAVFPAGQMPGTDGLLPYSSCVRIDVAAGVLGSALGLDFGSVDESHPICETTRTTISAIRIGDHVIGTLPGEVSVLLADLARSNSPVDEAHTIVVGYAQGHVGYMLRPEDWVLGGYEPSVTFWGPLEAEYLEEQLVKLWPLAMTSAREDGTTGGADRLATHHVIDNLPKDDPAPGAGTVPGAIPSGTWVRTGAPATAQPAAQVPRVSGLATFVFEGDDPLVATPVVTLQFEVSTNAWADVKRRSGRPVSDGDLLLSWTPSPLVRAGAQTHVWVVEWQAVPWLGDKGLDTLDARAAVPLGNYRFHVVGHGWTLDSQPFAVVPGGLAATAAHNGTNANEVDGTIALDAEQGYRLMDMNLPSNHAVPYPSQALHLVFTSTGTTVITADVTSDTAGHWTYTHPLTQNADHVTVTDTHGNSVSVVLPPI